jgi:SP family general alpha glucoside:H+ symporter-like MFS transporter
MAKAGRRTLHFSGVCALFIILIIVGCLSFAKTSASLWAIGGMLILFTFLYDFTVGPVTYSLVSELPSTRLKAKTIVLARALYNISNIVVNVLTNYQLSKTAWNWGAHTAFFWAGPAVAWLFGWASGFRNQRAGHMANWIRSSSIVFQHGSSKELKLTHMAVVVLRKR